MSSDETHTREEIEDARRYVQTWQSPPSDQTLGEAIAHLAETVNAERTGGAVYDDCETSCPHCSVGLDFDRLCDCDTDPMCVRCHRLYHVENARRHIA